MLQVNKARLPEQQTFPVAEFVTPAEIYAAVVGFLRRQHSVILFVFLSCSRWALSTSSPAHPDIPGMPSYSLTSIKVSFCSPQASVPDVPLDSAAVDTQIEIIKSQNIALSVIKDLHLNQDPEFISPRAGFIGAILGFVTNTLTSAVNLILPSEKSASGSSPDFRVMQTALGTFESRLSVGRVGLTYAIDINFQSYNPDRAAQIANAVAEAYVVEFARREVSNDAAGGDVVAGSIEGTARAINKCPTGGPRLQDKK